MGFTFSLLNSTLLGSLIMTPFLVKIPIFPFYYWLPEVHAEANTSISLFLAGMLLVIVLNPSRMHFLGVVSVYFTMWYT